MCLAVLPDSFSDIVKTWECNMNSLCQGLMKKLEGGVGGATHYNRLLYFEHPYCARLMDGIVISMRSLQFKTGPSIYL